ncbi:C3 and PZP-like alpha-2-macroglobulin domain-containing protein 8 [Haliotis rubra]|uniref:C3 and PZP-like alpha-2-macroglobulin domain-containing protein 8 n=1 Tax=Haliotis rubra TaxID=36100 RepID=UPI001EE5900C|nr:C3 and PZP-like alpha-2-macroglobulin domain-containing protein 8 [Haliotis rubra]
MKMRFSINIISGFFLLVCGSSTNINIITTGNRTVYNAHDYGVDVKNISSILFRVKGCTDGRINLFEGPNFAPAKNADILLGGWANRKCSMLPCSGCTTLESEWVTSVLNCNEMRSMWVNWTGRLLSVGHGAYVGEHTFMSTEEERDFDVQYLGVGSSYNDVFDWEFDGNAGNYFERVVPYGWSTRQTLSSVTASSMVNCIKSCQGRISCRSVSYQNTTNTCQLYFERSRSVDIQPDNTWETWTERNM